MGADHVHVWTECQSGGEFEAYGWPCGQCLTCGQFGPLDDLDERPTWREVAPGVAAMVAAGVAFAFLRPIVAAFLALFEMFGVNGG